MGVIVSLPNASSPVERILGRFDRAQLEGFIAVAIELLDLADGDPDVEPNGDELDGTLGEDDFHPQSANLLGEPGCSLSETGDCERDAQAGHVPTYGVDRDGHRMTEDQEGRSFAGASSQPIGRRRC